MAVTVPVRRIKLADSDKTTIQITIENKARLARYGAKDDSYDEILTRVLDRLALLESKEKR